MHMWVSILKKQGFVGDLPHVLRTFPQHSPFTETFVLLAFEVSCGELGTSQQSVPQS